MAIVTFIHDQEKDLYNIWETATTKNAYGYDFTQGVSQNIINLCKGKSFSKAKPELKKIMSNNIFSSELIEIYIRTLTKSWNLIEKEYLKRMNKIFEKKIPYKRINAYITTAGRCPYDPDEPSFMVSFFYNIPSALQTCGHEIMHLYFHKFYWAYVEKQIGQKKTSDLKEALTVLLNLEFKDLWFTIDLGYPNHEHLRNFIENEWKKEKNLKKLIEECIKYLK